MSDVKYEENDKRLEELKAIEKLLNETYAISQTNTEKALVEVEKVIERSLKAKNDLLIEKAYYVKGLINAVIGNHTEALKFYGLGISYDKDIDGEYTRIGFSLLNNSGISHLSLGNFNEALDFFLRAMKLAEKDDVKDFIAMVCLSIGETFRQLLDLDKALEYYLKAVDLYKEMQDNEGLAKALNDIGIVYENLEDLDKASDYYKMALDLFNKCGYKLGYAYTLNNLGMIEKRRRNLDEALKYFRDSGALISELGRDFSLSTNLANIGDTLRLMGKYDEALPHLERSLAIGEENKSKSSIIEAYSSLVDLFTDMKNYKKALEYHKLFAEGKDEVFKENYAKSIAEMQVKYEAEKKEREATIHYLRNVELERKNKLIEEQKKKLETKNELLYKLAITDKLTQIYNRTYIMDILEKEFANTKRHNLKMSVILFDIDDFKKINDKYGHLTGDYVLRNAADKISAMIRKDDIFGRYGGEEFMIIMPNTDSNGALAVADKIRRNFQSAEFHFDNLLISITISFGIAGIKDTLPDNITQFINFADHALYEAKEAGKNKALIYSNSILDIGQK